MTIDTLTLNRPQRRRVAWLGVAAPGDGRAVFEERGFEVVTLSAADLRNRVNLAPIGAVVFTQRAANLQAIADDLVDADARQLLDYDCRIIIRAFDRPDLHRLPLRIIATAAGRLDLLAVGLPPWEMHRLSRLRWSGQGEPPLPHVRVYGLNAQWSTIANFIMEHPPGAPPSPWPNLTIKVHGSKRHWRPGYEILLRRAFWDCTEVHLKPMDDGHSGVAVYCAHADLANGQLGRWLLPYFVKIGDRRKVFSEYLNYQDRVDPYIPFHLGPHLIADRCCLGASAGVIVGDFVEESESLVDCARDGRAGAAIACLFDRTLVGWHRSAQKERELSCQIANGFRELFPRMSADLQDRIDRAHALGATRDLGELRALFNCCDSTPVLVGPIHGDLHAGNVRVRATDAILIDFYRHQRGPLLYDAACLEASLLVEGFRDGRKYFRRSTPAHKLAQLDAEIREWMQSIESLYQDIPLQNAVEHPDPKHPTCWFHTCVRQIRRYAKEMEIGEHQYAGTLALALLTKATKDLGVPEPEASRRAAAYVFAERVLLQSFEGNGDYCI